MNSQKMSLEGTQAPPDESVFEFKKQDATADAFLGCKILYNWPTVGRIEEVVKRNVDRRMKIGC